MKCKECGGIEELYCIQCSRNCGSRTKDGGCCDAICKECHGTGEKPEAPEKIYAMPNLEGFWCDEKQNNNDIEYIRSDINDTQVTELETKHRKALMNNDIIYRSDIAELEENFKVAEEALKRIKENALDTNVLHCKNIAKEALSTIKGEEQP